MPRSELAESTIASTEAERIVAEGPLWPWIHRFFWEPARDLHPRRRAELVPAWQNDEWEDARTLGYVSRHLVSKVGQPDLFGWDSRSGGFRLALLPSAPLSRLARLMGLAITGCPVDPADEDARFAAERAPLYWRRSGDQASGIAFEQAGWRALREAVAGQPEAVCRRFEWKTPPGDEWPSLGGDDEQPLLALSRRVLREFEEPWCTLFAIPVR